MPNVVRLAVLAAGTALAGLTVVPSASAWTAGSEDGVLTIRAAGGEANRLDVDVAANGRISVSDEAGAPSALGASCSVPEDEVVVVCNRAGISKVVIRSGDLDDAVAAGEIGVPIEVYGEDGNDSLQTSAGDDVLDGGAGNDTLDSGAGIDRLTGADGDDQLAGGVGDDTLDGNAGVDTIDGDLGNDRVSGGDGGDQIDAGAGNDIVETGTGDDQVSGGDGYDVLSGATGRDRLTGDEGSDTLDGGDGDDDIDGGAGTDVLRGSAGDDLLQATDGADALDGGDGNDRFDGSEPANTLSGGAGDDVLNGFGGADTLDGGAGGDTLDGGLGADVLRGGDGRDGVSYEAVQQGVRVTLDGTADDGAVGEIDNVLPDVERLVGTAQGDTLIAGPGPVELQGGGGNDRLVGSAGPDVVSGGDGDDTLDGGGGADLHSGGEGSDTVTYETRTVAVAVSVGAGTGGDDGQRGEGDNVLADIERVIGSSRADTLGGASGLSIRFDGRAGNDAITLPGIPAGEDAVAGTGRAVCGTGTDTVVAGAEDAVAADCDVVTKAGRLTRFAVQGESSPRARITISRVRIAPDGRLRIPVYCASETKVRCNVGVHLNRGFKPIGRASAQVGRGRTSTIRVRVRRSAARRLLRSGGAVRLTVAVRDKGRATARGSAIVAVKVPSVR